MPRRRENLVWPISHQEQHRVLSRQFQGLFDHITGMADSIGRDVLLLGTPPLMHMVRILSEAALAMQKGAASGIHLVGDHPELAFLRGEIHEADFSLPLFLAATPPPMAFLRRIMRTASWTPWLRLAEVFVSPTATAVSHNHLLCEIAEKSPERLVFHHAESLLAAARSRSGEKKPDLDVMALAQNVAALLVDIDGLDEPWKDRLRRLILLLAGNFLAHAASDLDALLRGEDLPSVLWSAGGGYYPVRAVSLAVIRKGGTVRGFEHGGTLGFMEDKLMLAFGEFAAATEFVVSTKAKAALTNLTRTAEMVHPLHSLKILHHRGDPAFRFSRKERTSRNQRPRLVYISTTLLGFRQLYPPLLPDTVYLDWQLHLVEFLKTLPVDLVCRPHPESIVPGVRHPLEDIAMVASGPFHQLREAADIFIFDYPRTTSFWECLCTDKPVVYMNLNHESFNPELRPTMEKRCRFVSVTYDERNLPQFDRDALSQAIMTAPSRVDSGEIRGVLVGEQE
jgi:hypothetical protein